MTVRIFLWHRSFIYISHLFSVNSIYSMYPVHVHMHVCFVYIGQCACVPVVYIHTVYSDKLLLPMTIHPCG